MTNDLVSEWPAALRWRHVRPALLFLVLTAAAGWLGNPAASVPAAEPPSKVELPPELDLVPRDAAAFVHVRAAELVNSPMFADLRRLVAKAGAEAWQTFEKKCALPPAAIESISLVMPSSHALQSPFPSVDPEAVSALVVVTTRTPYDRLRLMRALGHREKAYRRNLYYFNENLWSGLILVDDRTFVIGSEDAVVQFFDLARTGRSSGPLQAALEQAARKPHVLVGLNARLLAKDKAFQAVPPPLQPLLEARCGTLALNLDKDMRLDCAVHYDQEGQAQAGAQAVRAALDLAVQGLSMPIQEIEKQLAAGPDGAAAADLPEKFFMLAGLGLLREVEGLLKTAPVERRGSVVYLPLQYRGGDTAQVFLFSLFGVTALGTNAYKTFSSVASTIGGTEPKMSPEEQHLRQLTGALEKYHEANGSYPPPALYDAGGRPILSWRVALLPYLGQQALYDEFKLDEPWDSLHNKRLINKMPPAYRAPNTWTKGKTPDLVFTGPNTIFEGKQGIAKGQVAGKTALIVLADSSRSVYWTKPADLVFEPGKPPPSLFAPHEDHARAFRTFRPQNGYAVTSDGTFRTIDRSAEEKVLRTMIERGPAAKAIARPATKPDDPDTIWNDFANGDDDGAEKAFAGVALLIRSPERALPLMKARLKPVPALDQQQVERWIAELDSDAFAMREKAARGLEQFGVAVLPALRKKLAEKLPSTESRKQLERLERKLEAKPFSADDLRGIRAAEVLRGIGTAEAQAVLESLAHGAEGAAQTTAARHALTNVRKRSGTN